MQELLSESFYRKKIQVKNRIDESSLSAERPHKKGVKK
jgi:hypothetical protein